MLSFEEFLQLNDMAFFAAAVGAGFLIIVTSSDNMKHFESDRHG